MDITFTADEERFREHARAWLAANAPKTEPPEHDLKARSEFDRAWQRKLHEAGYAGISWPKEYGGRGASLMEQLIWYEEFARSGAHDPSTLFVGLNHGGPTLIACGSDAQKAFHLPKILRGEVIWCQGFSEPGAGSDLAGLSTRAVIDGDDLVVSGQKIWTSFAQIAQWQELLVRTDPDAPKHKGITWVICPMGLPGMEIREIKTMGGGSDFCEVFYDEVRIPRANIVGKLNDGWNVAMSTLSFERGTAFVSDVLESMELVRDLAELAKTITSNGATRWEDVGLRREIGRIAAEFDALWALTKRNISQAQRTGLVGVGGNVFKIAWSDLRQHLGDVTMRLLDRASLSLDDVSELPTGRHVHARFYAISMTIAAGTSQVNRNIVGERVLGLPKDR